MGDPLPAKRGPPRAPSKPRELEPLSKPREVYFDPSTLDEEDDEQQRMASNSTSTATVSEGGIPTLLLRGDAARHQADLIHGHEARAQQQQQQRSTMTRPDGLRSDREYHEAWTGGDPGESLSFVERRGVQSS